MSQIQQQPRDPYDIDECEHKTKDEMIQHTNIDATACRFSAASIGYLSDPYVQAFVKSRTRHQALINRGTWLRCLEIDRIVSQFCIQTGGRGSILSIGAGFDTRYWRMKNDLNLNFRAYYEVDFEPVVRKKCSVVARNTGLKSAFRDLVVQQNGLNASDYHLICGDVRDWPSAVALLQNLCGLNNGNDEPLLLLAECVLVYMTPMQSDAILQWMSARRLGQILVYENIKLHDNFGDIMVNNIESRGIPLAGIDAYRTVDSHESRMTRLGLDCLSIRTMKDVYDQLTTEQLDFVGKLELLDEVEELHLLLNHYVIIHAQSKAQEVGAADLMEIIT